VFHFPFLFFASVTGPLPLWLFHNELRLGSRRPLSVFFSRDGRIFLRTASPRLSGRCGMHDVIHCGVLSRAWAELSKIFPSLCLKHSSLLQSLPDPHSVISTILFLRASTTWSQDRGSGILCFNSIGKPVSLHPSFHRRPAFFL